jgi:hypothetical protein
MLNEIPIKSIEYLESILILMGISSGVINTARQIVNSKEGADVVVLTGAGASKPFGVPDMSTLHNICEESDNGRHGGFTYSGINTYFGDNDLEEMMSNLLSLKKSLEMVSIKPDQKKFLNIYTSLLNSVADIMKKEIIERARSDKELYENSYGKMASFILKKKLALFTTNYDLIFENNYKCHSGSSSFHDIPAAKASNVGINQNNMEEYYKLHGSIEDSEEIDGIFMPVISKSVSANDVRFHTLYTIFAYHLLKAKMVVIIGQSLRDIDIKYLVEEACAISGARLIIIDPSPPADLQAEDSRISKSIHKIFFGTKEFADKFHELMVYSESIFNTYPAYKSKTYCGYKLPIKDIRADIDIVSNYSESIGEYSAITPPSEEDDKYFKGEIYPNLYECIILKHFTGFIDSERIKWLIAYAAEQINLAKEPNSTFAKTQRRNRKSFRKARDKPYGMPYNYMNKEKLHQLLNDPNTDEQTLAFIYRSANVGLTEKQLLSIHPNFPSGLRAALDNDLYGYIA